MLKIVYPICCGIDVHKTFIVACIASTNGQGVTTYQSKRFSTFTNDLRRCAVWLAKNHCKDVCMESTGKYWIPVYNILEVTCTIVLAHPKYVKTIRGKKTDKKDAKWIADIFKHDLVSGSFIPPGGYPPTSGFDALSLETDQLHHWGKESRPKLPDGFQYQTGRCVFRCLWQSGFCYYDASAGMQRAF